MREIPVLETARLVIRPFRPDDFDAVHLMFDSEGHEESWSTELRQEWLAWVSANPRFLALLVQPPYGDRAVTLKDGTLAGAVGVVPYFLPLDQLPSFGAVKGALAQAEVGLYWAFAPDHRRKGYATEAARALADHLFRVERLKRIIADTAHSNLASQGVMRKLGMRIEKNPFPEPEWLQVVGILDHPDIAEIAPMG